MATSRHSRPLRTLAAASLALALATTGSAVVAESATAATPATTTIYVPNLIQAGVPTTLVATVSQDATLGAPTGTVAFSTGFGAVIGTATLVAGTNGQASASYAWTPPVATTVPVLATYTATGSATATSTSVIMRPEITAAAVPVALRFAPTLSAGANVLSGVLGYSSTAGTVAFLVDGAGWTGSVPTVDGVGSVTWQATAGVHTIVVQYSSYATNPSGASLHTGTSTQIVKVLP